MSHRPPKDLDEQARQARASSPPTAAWRPGARSSSPRRLPRRRGRRRPRALPRGAGGGGARRHGAGSTIPPRSRAPTSRIAVFGGIYNNHLASPRCWRTRPAAAPRRSTAWATWAASARNPEKVWPLLAQGGVRAIQGNYEESLASGREDCNCGYTDPRDNHFAEISYGYTARSCSPDFKAWMGTLPRRRRVRVGGPRAAARPRLAAADQRVPLPEHLAGAVPGGAARPEPAATASSAPTPGCTGTAASPPAATSSTSASSAGPPTTATPTSGTRCWRRATEELGRRARAARLRPPGVSPPRCAARSCPRSSSRPSSPAGGRPAWRSCPPASGRLSRF